MGNHANNPQQTLDVQTQWEEIYSDPQTAHKNKYPTELVVSTVFRNFKTRAGLKALDLGCGWGNNLRFLRDAGFDAYGIEISRTAVESMRDEFGDHVVQGTFLERVHSKCSGVSGVAIAVGGIGWRNSIEDGLH